MKSIKVTKSEKNFIVKIVRDTVNNMRGLSVMVFIDSENSPCVMSHFLDFSSHPANEIEQNMMRFSNHCDENFALEWVDGYLSGRR